MAPTVIDQVKSFMVLPNVILGASVLFHIQTAILHPKLLLGNFASYRNEAFARLWAVFGGMFAKETPPALDGLLSSSRGVILDVGPGTGDQTFRFDQPENISMIYGVEPGLDMHAKIYENVAKVGLGAKYKVIGCGAQPDQLIPALAKQGLIGNSGARTSRSSQNSAIFDEIVCIRVLCGVPNQEATIRGLYSLLKPGGRFVVCEHVVNSGSGSGKGKDGGGSMLGVFFQHWYTYLGWSFWLGDCDLRRDTMKVLDAAAASDDGWARKQVQLVDGWSCLPHIVGYLIKKK